MLHFLQELCDDQESANRLCRPHHVHRHSHHNSSVVNSTLLTDSSSSRISPLCYKPKGQYRFKYKSKHLNITTPLPSQRGVIYTGAVRHFKKIFQSITALRMTNCSLPVEIWVTRSALPPCRQVIEQLLPNTRCRQFTASVEVSGWTSKFYALLFTNLDDALFIDADNVPVRDVNEVFDSAPYQETGAVLWPDLWGSNCSKGALTVPGSSSSDFCPNPIPIYIF